MSTLEQLIPEGYKHTDSGVIPDDWKVLKIDDMSTKVGSGKTPTGGASVYVDSGRPFVRSQNVGSGRLRLADLTYITEETHSTFTGSELKTDDVLLNITGASIGRCALATPSVDGGNVNQHVCIIRVNRAKVAPYLIQTLINSDSGQNQIDSYQAGGNREGLNFSQVRSMQFPLSNHIEEQTAIANALSDVDALFAELEKLIAKKQAIKTATMQQLLTGKTRLPQFATYTEGEKQGQLKGTKPSELGEISEDWDVLPFSKIFNYQNGKAQEHLFNSNDGYKVISIGNYSESGKYVETGSFIDKRHSSEVGRFVLKKGELTMILNDKTAVGTIIGRVLLIDKNDTYIMNQRTMRLSPKEEFNSQYLFGLINSEFVHQRIVGMAKPGTQIYINTDDVLDFQVQLPTSKEEQAGIAKIYMDMDSEIQTLEQRLAKTRQIKQGMMQELLTGRTRLPFKKES